MEVNFRRILRIGVTFYFQHLKKLLGNVLIKNILGKPPPPLKIELFLNHRTTNVAQTIRLLVWNIKYSLVLRTSTVPGQLTTATVVCCLISMCSGWVLMHTPSSPPRPSLKMMGVSGTTAWCSSAIPEMKRYIIIGLNKTFANGKHYNVSLFDWFGYWDACMWRHCVLNSGLYPSVDNKQNMLSHYAR